MARVIVKNRGVHFELSNFEDQRLKTHVLTAESNQRTLIWIDALEAAITTAKSVKPGAIIIKFICIHRRFSEPT